MKKLPKNLIDNLKIFQLIVLIINKVSYLCFKLIINSFSLKKFKI